jgi:hypothetical protein
MFFMTDAELVFIIKNNVFNMIMPCFFIVLTGSSFSNIWIAILTASVFDSSLTYWQIFLISSGMISRLSKISGVSPYRCFNIRNIVFIAITDPL